MVKRVLLISIFSLSILASFQLVSAASPPVPVEGMWLVAGKLNATAKFPALVTVSASLSNLRAFGEVFSFNADKSFSEDLFGLVGTWEQNESSFTVQIDLDALLKELEQFGIRGEISKYAFSGKVQNNGKMTGKIILNLDLTTIPPVLSGTMTLSGTFTGTAGPTVLTLSERSSPTARFHSLASFIAERLLSPIPW